jgi:hypothetical protein
MTAPLSPQIYKCQKRFPLLLEFERDPKHLVDLKNSNLSVSEIDHTNGIYLLVFIVIPAYFNGNCERSEIEQTEEK